LLLTVLRATRKQERVAPSSARSRKRSAGHGVYASAIEKFRSSLRSARRTAGHDRDGLGLAMPSPWRPLPDAGAAMVRRASRRKGCPRSQLTGRLYQSQDHLPTCQNAFVLGEITVMRNRILCRYFLRLGEHYCSRIHATVKYLIFYSISGFGLDVREHSSA
jgi:hypothetical protein